MIKITKQHYIIKLLAQLIPHGVATAQYGDITVNVQYPDDDLGVFTVTLTHTALNCGVVFNILNNAENTTIIQSTTDEYGGVWYNAHATINNKYLTAIWA